MTTAALWPAPAGLLVGFLAMAVGVLGLRYRRRFVELTRDSLAPGRAFSVALQRMVEVAAVVVAVAWLLLGLVILAATFM